MTGLLQMLAGTAAAGIMLFSAPADMAAPQHDADGTLFLINRQWRVSENYEPEIRLTNVPGQVRYLRPDASLALEEMYAACKEDIGVTLISASGYRSYGKQYTLYTNKLKRVGTKEKADEYVARPGASEHQLGLAMDVGQRNRAGFTASFGKTEGGKWISENCWKYGFVLRYGKEWEDVTGYKFEPWHFRYVGKEYAEEIHKANVPLETWLSQKRGEVLLSIVTGEIIED